MKAKDYQKTERRARLNKGKKEEREANERTMVRQTRETWEGCLSVSLELLVRALIGKHAAFTESVGGQRRKGLITITARD